MLINPNKIQKFIPCLSSGYFFSNQKTSGVAVDFRLCPMMSRVELPEGKRKFVSKTCPGCYSANILTVYQHVSTKLISAPDPETDGQLALFEQDCIALKTVFPAIQRLRFYALSDFHPSDIPYIHVARKHFTVDIISKALIFPKNETHLHGLFNVPNVWISLSFNKTFLGQIGRIREMLEVHNPNNVNMNYALNYKEENPDDPFFDQFQVFHLKNNHKRDALNLFDRLQESNTCAILDREGNPVRAHGVCDACTACHNSFGDYMRGQRAALRRLATPVKSTRKGILEACGV